MIPELNDNSSLKLLKNLGGLKYIFILFFLCLTLFLSCKPETEIKTEDISLFDFNEFYKYSDKDTIYPTIKQIEMLKAVMPQQSYKPAPSIKDRAYWGKVALSISGKEYLSKAQSELDKAPEVPISDEIYRRANKEGNRGIYKPRYYRTMERLENFILAECIENEGRFLSQIETYIEAIIQMKSWLHPNHDDNNNGVLEGKRVSIDLGARKFGTDLALASVLLENKLSEELCKKIQEHIQKRIIDTYLKSCKTLDQNNKWIKSSSNWNSVCTSGSVFSTIAVSNSQEERIAAVGSALNSMNYYLNGFGDDGYCSEGVGYWGYGFGHYLYLAKILHHYTDGKIDLFDAGNPEKLKNVGSFPERYEMHKGKAAPFSDGVSKISNSYGFPSILSSFYLGAKKPVMDKIHLGSDLKSRNKKTTNIFSDEAAYQLIAWELSDVFETDTINSVSKDKLPGYTYFDHFGMIISRGNQETPLSIAIKAGHNKENHNHMDVGSYSIVLNEDHLSGDIGAPSYTAGAFSDTNPVRSSWGHPVPRIAGKLQSKGRKFAGKITKTEFTDTYDEVVIDILGAYEIPSLKKLHRTMKNDKLGEGVITIKDAFTSSEPISFGTAIMTLSKYKIIDDATIILTSENQEIKVEVSSNDGALKIIDELVPIKKLREGGPAYRIGVDFEKPISEGEITVKFTPML